MYSPGKLAVALAAGFPPESISVNGVPKDETHIYRSIEAGVRLTIDSLSEVDLIEKTADELGCLAKVRLRLTPPISGFIDGSDFVSEGMVTTDVVALVYKGGLSFDKVVAVGRRILGMNKVRLVGLHRHHGRHHPSLRYRQEQMKAFAREAGRVCRALGGFQPEEIDIGGGFAIPRDPFNSVTDYTEPLQLGALYTLLKGPSYLGAKTRYKWKLIVVDTTEFWFTSGRHAHHLHDYLFATKADVPLIDKADIVGRSRYGDRLMPSVRIPEVIVGDILALLDTWDYQEVSMSNFNASPRPATVLVTGDQASIIRRRETEDNVYRRDVMPEHLQRRGATDRVTPLDEPSSVAG